MRSKNHSLYLCQPKFDRAFILASTGIHVFLFANCIAIYVQRREYLCNFGIGVFSRVLYITSFKTTDPHFKYNSFLTNLINCSIFSQKIIIFVFFQDFFFSLKLSFWYFRLLFIVYSFVYILFSSSQIRIRHPTIYSFFQSPFFSFFQTSQ